MISPRTFAPLAESRTVEQVCYRCKGVGRLNGERCWYCSGHGRNVFTHAEGDPIARR